VGKRRGTISPPPHSPGNIPAFRRWDASTPGANLLFMNFLLDPRRTRASHLSPGPNKSCHHRSHRCHPFIQYPAHARGPAVIWPMNTCPRCAWHAIKRTRISPPAHQSPPSSCPGSKGAKVEVMPVGGLSNYTSQCVLKSGGWVGEGGERKGNSSRDKKRLWQ
jgi:hypothetical protein